MTYLVDANVLSEATRPQPNAKAVEWLTRNERLCVVDAIVLAEIQLGILSLPHGRKRTKLEDWYRSVVKTVECLPWDRSVSLRWATLVSGLRRRGVGLPVMDSMIAATALTHGLVVATRNVSDFRRTGVSVVNPFL
jgi:hypothetical protein